MSQVIGQTKASIVIHFLYQIWPPRNGCDRTNLGLCMRTLGQCVSYHRQPISLSVLIVDCSGRDLGTNLCGGIDAM